MLFTVNNVSASISCRSAAYAAIAALLLGASTAADAETSAVPEPSPTVPPDYVLDWHDEFDAPISSDRWAVFLPPERQTWARSSREAVGHDGSYLVLSAIQKGNDILYGWLTTQPLYCRRYGYFEARLAAPAARGWRAAFWLMSPTLGRPLDRPDLAGAEVQIVSRIAADLADRAFSHAVYWNPPEGLPYLVTNREGVVRVASNAPPPTGVGSLVPNLADADASDSFHVHGLLWTEREYVFYVDGRETWRSGRGVAGVPLFLCLALLPDPRGSERPMRVDTPARLLCDYVRVYAPPPAASSATPTEPSDP